ncbi:carbamoyltransferase [candidate division KSB1 bacterium]|nr:carbamoyltransferase [candidate division KSB1 bacterium]
MKILGISAYYHDSAACLVVDGELVAAAQEERFTRKKHDAAFPKHAINFCLSQHSIQASDLDLVAFYEKPLIKFERILETYLAYAPFGIRSFVKAMPLWLKKKLWMKDLMRSELDYSGAIIFPEHHESHAASAFYPSPFNKSAFLTIDGVGEWTTSSFGIGEGNRIKLLAELQFPHSLGLLYSAFTYYTGFKVNSGEYKLMGLAPFGQPRYVSQIFEELLDLKEDGSFRLNLDYFSYCHGLRMINRKFEKLFGQPPRKPESRLTRFYMDISRSIQVVTEDIILRMSRHLHQVTGMQNLCLAGGVALNCVANGRILRESPFDDIWIQPAAGDAGGALGAALFGWYQYLDKARKTDEAHDFQKASLLGPEFKETEINEFLIKQQVPFVRLEYQALIDRVADLIARGNVIGWFQGRMEFGPRALGNRSIIGDARSPEMQEKMNLKIKFRESFRPFAPSVLAEKADTIFDLNHSSPYMLLVAPVTEKARIHEDAAGDEMLIGLDKLNQVRSIVPAITHVDYSARIQTVAQSDNPLFYCLLRAFDKKYSCPLIINTSFNVRGEPIVCTPEDAYLCFMRTNMDFLVLGNYLIEKRAQKPLPKDIDWLREFELD